jgi:hypothetical protein|uniref:3'-5' exonuclease domain-containing protein n=1 Tax=Fagus sylvatica TaxID=28930 RepID=A0A2N9G2R7_FAGSY
MSNSIPLSFLSKIGICEAIEIHGKMVQVSVVLNSAVLVAKINELKSSLVNSEKRVVGIDFKFIQPNGSTTGTMLLLCDEKCCLIIPLVHLNCVPKTLKQFLADETICFLGTGMNDIVRVLLEAYDMQCGTGIDVGFLAADILKKPDIENSGLAELAGEVGEDHIKDPIFGQFPDWNARVFSKEQMKYAMHNAYTSYVLGKKLLDIYSLFQGLQCTII